MSAILGFGIAIFVFYPVEVHTFAHRAVLGSSCAMHHFPYMLAIRALELTQRIHTHLICSSVYPYRFATDQSTSDLFSCFNQDPVECWLRDLHMICCILLIHSQIILQSYALHLFHLQDNFTCIL